MQVRVFIMIRHSHTGTAPEPTTATDYDDGDDDKNLHSVLVSCNIDSVSGSLYGRIIPNCRHRSTRSLAKPVVFLVHDGFVVVVFVVNDSSIGDDKPPGSEWHRGGRQRS